jgi:hypothetical protein
MATSLPVAIASNQSAIPVTNAGGTATVTLAGGTALLAGGTASITLLGGTALVTLAGGTAAVSLTGGTAVLAGGTASINVNQINGVTLGFGQAVMATSLPVVIASNQSAIPVTGAGGTSTVTLAGGTASVTLAGGTASITLAGGTALVTLAGGTSALQLTGYTSFPTAVANAALATAISDKAGRIISVAAARDWRASQTATITTAAETTVINPVNATTFADVYGVILANTGSTTCKVDFRHGTGSAILFSIQSYSSDTRGFMLPVDAAIVGSLSTANVSWTAQPSATASINVSMFYVKNI